MSAYPLDIFSIKIFDEVALMQAMKKLLKGASLSLCLGTLYSAQMHYRRRNMLSVKK